MRVGVAPLGVFFVTRQSCSNAGAFIYNFANHAKVEPKDGYTA